MFRWAVKALGGSVRAVLVVLILFSGAGTMVALKSLKEPPAKTEMTERVLRVEVMRASPGNYPVIIRGLGEARALNVVAVSPEVSGNVVAIHPRLELGEVIPAGKLLFRIDPRDYQVAVQQAEARVAQLGTALERVRKQYDIDLERVKTLERTRGLRLTDLERTRTLLKSGVGTQNNVDTAEMAYNQARDAHDLLSQQISLYPLRIKEAKDELSSAKAQLRLAKTNLERTEVRAAFDARIKDVQVEVGQYVRAGSPVLELSDDSMLEIRVPVDSRDARTWLKFRDESSEERAWFEKVEPVACRVKWVEAPDEHAWRGILSRVTAYDSPNRTVTLAVRVTGEDALRNGPGLPLVDGMFCSVEVPGREMKDVYELPRWAVNFRNEVYVARDGRLVIQPVKVVRSEGENTYVSEGLHPGDAVIVTRLVDPAPGTLLDIAKPTEGAAS